jgi:hypothetical protein
MLPASLRGDRRHPDLSHHSDSGLAPEAAKPFSAMRPGHYTRQASPSRDEVWNGCAAGELAMIGVGALEDSCDTAWSIPAVLTKQAPA